MSDRFQGRRFFILVCAWLIVCQAATVRVRADDFLTDTPQPLPVVPATPEELNAAIQRGVDFLLQDQNANGSWGAATSTKNLNIYAPIPGAHHAFRAAVTSLAISALIHSGDQRPEVRQAIETAAAWLEQELPDVRRATGDAIYNVWAHAYSIEALCDLLESYSTDNRVEKWRRQIEEQIKWLERYRSVNQGWGYYDFVAEARIPTSSPTSFTTATALVALYRAQQLGIEVPEKLVQGSIRLVQRTRKPDFSYYYSYGGPTTNQPMRSINRPGGSLGRSQACNYALRLWGDDEITDRVMNVWLDRLFARNLWLDIGRKRPVPHESYFLVAGYFFYYGHWYAARSFEMLPVEDRTRHQHQMGRLIIDLQEKDGSWWDYPFYAYHQPYGTAMAVMTLVDCREPAAR